MQLKYASLLIRNLMQREIPLLRQTIKFPFKLPNNSFFLFIAPVNNILHCRSYSMVGKMGYVKPPKIITKKQVEERVLKAVKSWDRFPSDRIEKLSLTTRFLEDLGFDSLDHIEIVMCLEDEFGFEILDTDIEKFKTPNDIIAYVCEHEDVYE